MGTTGTKTMENLPTPSRSEESRSIRVGGIDIAISSTPPGNFSGTTSGVIQILERASKDGTFRTLETKEQGWEQK